MEKDDEIKGSGNSYDFGARMFDSRLGRFLSVDPDYFVYPWLSTYAFAANSPISLIDFEGRGPKKKKKKGLTRAKIVKFTFYEIWQSVEKQGGLDVPTPEKMVPSMEVLWVATSFESLTLKMYDADGDKNGNATIGFGHLIHTGKINGGSSETEFKDGITLDAAVKLLMDDVKKISKTVNQQVKNRGLTGKLTQNQFDVAFDLGFNAGTSAAGSYLNKVKKINKLEAAGKTKKLKKAQGNLEKWLLRQYPGNDKARGEARELMNYDDGIYQSKEIIDDVTPAVN